MKRIRKRYIILLLLLIPLLIEAHNVYLFFSLDDEDELRTQDNNFSLYDNDKKEKDKDSDWQHSYDQTRDAAKEIEGDTLLAAVYNAMVKASRASGYTTVTVDYLIGINIVESQYHVGTWIPDTGIPNTQDFGKKYTLTSYGYKDAFDYKRKTGYINISPSGAIGSFQVMPGVWHASPLVRNNSVAESDFEVWVTSAKKRDLSGDGKGDPFNYIDSLMYVVNRHNWDSSTSVKQLMARTKWASSSKLEEVATAMHIAHYNGITPLSGSFTFPSNPSVGGRKDFPWDENINPYIQLHRKIIEERDSNGPYYRKYQETFQRLFAKNSPNVFHKELVKVIFEFYQANGWVVDNPNGLKSSVRYDLGQIKPEWKGRYMIIGPANSRYAASALWGGMSTRLKIEELLKVKK